MNECCLADYFGSRSEVNWDSIGITWGFSVVKLLDFYFTDVNKND